MVAGALTLLSIVPAAAQDQLPSNSLAPVRQAAVESCEARMLRLAGLSKVIGANYNAAHVDEVCEATTGYLSDQ
jgi:hypothetical protein